MMLDAEKKRTYGASRMPVATYSAAGSSGIEVLDKVEIPWRGNFRRYVVWRRSSERNHPRMSCIRDMANDGSGFRVGRKWIRLSECGRADR